MPSPQVARAIVPNDSRTIKSASREHAHPAKGVTLPLRALPSSSTGLADATVIIKFRRNDCQSRPVRKTVTGRHFPASVKIWLSFAHCLELAYGGTLD